MLYLTLIQSSPNVIYSMHIVDNSIPKSPTYAQCGDIYVENSLSNPQSGDSDVDSMGIIPQVIHRQPFLPRRTKPVPFMFADRREFPLLFRKTGSKSAHEVPQEQIRVAESSYRKTKPLDIPSVAEAAISATPNSAIPFSTLPTLSLGFNLSAQHQQV